MNVISQIKRKGFFHRLRAKAGNNLMLTIIFIALYATAAIAKPSVFLNLDSFKSMSYQASAMGLMSLGMLVCMIAGGIDLSIVGVHNLVGMVVGTYVSSLFPESASFIVSVGYMASAVLIALIIGASCGYFNGFLIAKVGIPPILATMGTSYLYLGICLIVKKGSAVSGMGDLFINTIQHEIAGAIPLQLLIFLAGLLVVNYLLRYTKYGLKLYMFGSNRNAAKYAGLNNDSIVIRTHMISSILCALAGVLTLARNNSSRADYGSTLTTQGILICVLGGVNPSGGSGNVYGTAIAVLILQVFSTGLNMFRDTNAFMRDFAWGLVLIFAMVSNFYSAKKKARRE